MNKRITPIEKHVDHARSPQGRTEPGEFLVPNTTVIEEKKDPVTGETLMWNGRPVLQGRHMTVEEWEAKLKPEGAQAGLLNHARNPNDDPNPPKLASPPMPPVIR